MLLPNAYFISEVIGHLRESGSTVVRKAEYGSAIGWVRIYRRYERLNLIRGTEAVVRESGRSLWEL